MKKPTAAPPAAAVPKRSTARAARVSTEDDEAVTVRPVRRGDLDEVIAALQAAQAAEQLAALESGES